MEKKKVKKFLIIILFFTIILVLNTTIVQAGAGNIYKDVEIKDEDKVGVEDIGNKIFDSVRTIAIICSVIGLTIIGIRYMMSSVEEKAERKKMLINYLIGVILAFGITTLAEFVYTVVKGISDNV